jgi:hypothetical protein
MKQLPWVEMTDETRVAVSALLNATVMPGCANSQINRLASSDGREFKFAAKFFGARFDL